MRVTFLGYWWLLGKYMAEIKTLVDDIYNLFDPNHGHEPNEDNLNEFG